MEPPRLFWYDVIAEVPTVRRTSRFIRWTAALFAGLALAHFFFFILLHPLDWQQPETLRMRYHSLQEGVQDGPLISRLTGADFLKPLSNLSRGGGYEARYVTKLIDGLQAKFWQQVYSLSGPFLGEPLNVLLLLFTGVLLFLAAREWFASSPGALAAAGFWFFTSQVLLDSRYPIRPNMLLAATLSGYMLWEFLRWRRLSTISGPLIRLGVAFFVALTCHEFVVFSIFPLLIIALSQRRLFGIRRILLLAAVLAGTVAAYAVFFRFLYPFAMRRLIGEEPLTMWLGDNSPLDLIRMPVLLERLGDFTLAGIWYYLGENWGLNFAKPRWMLLLAGTGVFLVCVTAFKGRRLILVPLAGAFFFYLMVSLILFPYVPASVEMPVYYYTLPVFWSVFPLAAILAEIVRKEWVRLWTAALAGFLLIAAANASHSARVMKEMPADFGFTPAMREYVRDILDLGDYILAAGIDSPIYFAYPRPRRFDVSTRWDIMLRVWHGESDQVFSMMLPVLHLKDFEARNMLGNQEEFAKTAPLDSGEYELAASALADMPQRGWYDLRLLRQSVINPGEPPVWTSDQGEEAIGRIDSTLLGRAYRTILPAGTWRTNILWRKKSPEQKRLVYLARADIQATGSDEVWYRVSPLPVGTCVIKVTDGSGGRRIPHSYGWSYQLREWPLAWSGQTGEIELEVISEGEIEIVGPVAVPRDAVQFYRWQGNEPLGGI